METQMINLLAIAAIACVIAVCFTIIRRVSSRLQHESRAPAGLSDPFIVKPSIQLGDGTGDFEIVFAGIGEAKDYKLRVYGDRTGTIDCAPASSYLVNVPDATPTIPVHRVFRVPVKGLDSGEPFTYRINFQGNQVFNASSRAPVGIGEKSRVIVTGDIAKWGADERRIANRIYAEKPNLLALVGDIAYDQGLLSEYLAKFFPAYNADEAGDAIGAPILRSIQTVAVAGNHCVGRPDTMSFPDFGQKPDHFGYFVYWSQPLNGPIASAAAKAYGPDLVGPKARKDAILAAGGNRLPRMLNFSFDHGDAHWVVLDSNQYMDWTDPAMRDWLEKDLAATTRTWKFVMFHHSCFHTSRKHQDGVRMRLVADIFQKQGVDIVFTGHVHTYERTFPLKFNIKRNSDNLLVDQFGRVDGDIVLDKNFDGVDKTHPDGVIYVTTGAGGAPLHREAMPEIWQPQTAKAVSGRHSLTVMDMYGSKIVVRQITAQGEELDRFTLTK